MSWLELRTECCKMWGIMKNGEMTQKTSVKGVKEEMGYVMGRTKKRGGLFFMIRSHISQGSLQPFSQVCPWTSDLGAVTTMPHLFYDRFEPGASCALRQVFYYLSYIPSPKKTLFKRQPASWTWRREKKPCGWWRGREFGLNIQQL